MKILINIIFIIIGVFFVGCMDDSYDSASIQNLYPESTTEQELINTNLYETLLSELEMSLSSTTSSRTLKTFSLSRTNQVSTNLSSNQISMIVGDPHFQTLATVYDPIFPSRSFRQFQTSGIGNFVDNASWSQIMPILQYSEFLGGIGFRYAFSIDEATPAQAFLHVRGSATSNKQEFTFVSKRHEMGTRVFYSQK